MNKHFEDTRYYLKRASEHAKAGVKEEIEPIETKVRDLTGRDDEEEEEEPELSRVDKVRENLKELEQKAEGESKKAIANAREQLGEYRNKRAE